MSCTNLTSKAEFLANTLSASVLRLGTFLLKSGRCSPYFFDAGALHRADVLNVTSAAYAQLIHDRCIEDPQFSFDVIFGPAYKGIPLATSVLIQLAHLDLMRYGQRSYSFNRKEKKNHGEGGELVGAPIKGRKVLIIDDVISAGTATREAVDIIQREGGILVGIVVALDRQERMPISTFQINHEMGNEELSTLSTLGQLKRDLGVPIMSILTLDDILAEARTRASAEEIKRFEEYWQKYRASDS